MRRGRKHSSHEPVGHRRRAAGVALPRNRRPRLDGHVVFTSLYGTLVDEACGDFNAARATLRQLHERSVPVVPVTRRTFHEVEPLARELDFRHALIVESAGAIAWRSGDGWELEPCGGTSEDVLEVVREIEERTGADLVVYSVLPEDEAARVSGLRGEALVRSRQRHFDEPFLVASGDICEITTVAEAMGFAVHRGRRFYHLVRRCDHGGAFRRVRERLGCDAAIGLGSVPADADFLTSVEIPIIVPRADGTPDPELVAKLPHAAIAPAPASAGWAAAINAVGAPMAGAARGISPARSRRYSRV